MAERGKESEVVSGRLFADDLNGLKAAAHELKSPLALIRQLSLELEMGDYDQVTISIIEQIKLTAEKSLRLTTNLTKSHHAQTQLFPTSPVNLGQVFDEVERELMPLYRAHGRIFRQKRRKTMPVVVANKDLLRRILCNFGDNALQYAGQDGAVELFMQLKRDGGRVRLGVRDYGPALPASLWRAVRNQAPPTARTPSRPESSGLGLVIAGQFADAIGGSVGAIRHRDGASFYVDVPISKQLSLL